VLRGARMACGRLGVIVEVALRTEEVSKASKLSTSCFTYLSLFALLEAGGDSRSGAEDGGGTQFTCFTTEKLASCSFTCFTSTKVQILTHLRSFVWLCHVRQQQQLMHADVFVAFCLFY
jgi:hypothetical protein